MASEKHGLLVGSPYYDTGTLADAGKVFFFLFVNATSSLHTTADWTVEGDQANGHLGKVVVGRGDPVGRGYANVSDTDIIASAPEYDSSGYTDNGKVLIWKTSSTTYLPISTTPDWTATGTATSAYFGKAVATIRGIKGDPNISLAVGAPGQSVVYVYYGSSSAAIPTSPSWSNTGVIASVTQNTTYSFGSAIAQRTDWILLTPDDVTGDGYADLIVGMPSGTAYNGSFASYVEIFHGSATGFGSAPDQSKQLAGLGFGTSVTYTDEVTNDSICDLAIGSPQENSLTGKAYVYAGGTSIFSASPVRTYTGENTGDQFGYCVAAAGRYSTLRTLVIGAP